MGLNPVSSEMQRWFLYPESKDSGFFEALSLQEMCYALRSYMYNINVCLNLISIEN